MPQGTIKKIVLDRGFGFIAAQPDDVFFHHTSVEDNRFDDLAEGQAVDYEIAEDDGRGKGKGPRAASVKPAE
jgi:CspA family cold shock protein